MFSQIEINSTIRQLQEFQDFESKTESLAHFLNRLENKMNQSNDFKKTMNQLVTLIDGVLFPYGNHEKRVLPQKVSAALKRLHIQGCKLN